MSSRRSGRPSSWILAASAGFVAAVGGLFLAWFRSPGGDAYPFGSDIPFRLDDLVGADAHLDGIAVATVAGLGLLVVAFHASGVVHSRAAGQLAGGLAGLLLASALLQFEWLANVERHLRVGATAGTGLWMLTGGAAVAMICALGGAQRRRERG